MKAVAIILALCVLLAGGVAIYGLMNTSLTVTGKGLSERPAAQLPEEFSALQAMVSGNALQGTLFKQDSLANAADYTYYIYTLRLKNNNLIAAETVELQISPLTQDILMYGETQEVVIAPGATRDVWCVLLSKDASPVRDIYVTYYYWGHPYQIKYTYEK